MQHQVDFFLFFIIAHLCEECGRSFSCERNLRQHKYTHQNYEHSCSDCPMKFPTELRLKRHFNRVHIDSVFVCNICGAELSTHNGYSNHISKTFCRSYSPFNLSKFNSINIFSFLLFRKT